MEELKTKAENLTKSVGEYVDTYYKLSIIKATDKATGIAAGGLAIISVTFLGIFVLFFLGIALGVWLGNILNNAALGYLLVATLFIIIIIVLVTMRKKIVFPFIRDLIIKKLYE